MKPISGKKHGWHFANMIPISVTKHKMTFWNVGFGSRFGHIFGRSKSDPKSIAIDQESLIKHSGMIKIPKTPQLF